MAWEVWWALVLGFAISAIVQAWVPRARIESALAGEGVAPIGRATVLGLASARAWSDVAHNFRGDWQMLWKEITAGFLLAGFISLLGADFFNGLFLEDSPAAVQAIWGALIGPLIAVLSFVCSVGNVPLA